MTWHKLLFLFASLQQILSFFDPESDVKILNQKNFKGHIKKQKLASVMFYAPWCGHCKNLKPEYAKAANELKDIISFAAVDASTQENSGLASKYEIKGFPTLFLFKNGKHVSFHGRTAKDIVDSLKAHLSDDYIVSLKADNNEEFFSLKKPKLVVFGGQENAPDILKSLSMQFNKFFSFGFVSKKEEGLQKNFNVKKFPTVLLFTDPSKGKNQTPKKFESLKPSELKSEIMTSIGAKFDEYEKIDILHDQSCLKKYCIDSGMLCVFYVEGGDEKEIARRRVVLQEARDDLLDETLFKFVRVDAKKHESYLKNLFGQNVKLSFPRVFLVSYKKKLFSPYKKAFETEPLSKFLASFAVNKPDAQILRFKASELPSLPLGEEKCPPDTSTIKSQRSPEEEKKSHVVAATNSNFSDLLEKTKMPVIVEFYAPWCKHCKALAPDYEKAAAKMEGAVLFVKVDVTEQKKLSDAYDVSSYPTLKFRHSQVPAGKSETLKNSKFPVLEKYSDARNYSALLQKAKALLKFSSTVKDLKGDFESFKKAAESLAPKTFGVFFLSEKIKSNHVMEAASVYFKGKNESSPFEFFRVPVSAKETRRFMKSASHSVFLLEKPSGSEKEKDAVFSSGIFKYKGTVSFPTLTKDFERFLANDTHFVDQKFDYEEVKEEKKVDEKKEL